MNFSYHHMVPSFPVKQDVVDLWIQIWKLAEVVDSIVLAQVRQLFNTSRVFSLHKSSKTLVEMPCSNRHGWLPSWCSSLLQSCTIWLWLLREVVSCLQFQDSPFLVETMEHILIVTFPTSNFQHSEQSEALKKMLTFLLTEQISRSWGRE